MKGIYTLALLFLSNIFMTFAWYGHLTFKDVAWFRNLGLLSVIFISWGIALLEYSAQAPANKIGFRENGGPFNFGNSKLSRK